MAVQFSGFFDSTAEVDNNYSQAQLAVAFRALGGTGAGSLDDGLRVQADGQADAGLAAFASQPVPPLDAAALLCLARHGGAPVQCGAGWVELDAAPARPDVTP